MEAKQDMTCYDRFFCTKKIAKEKVLSTILKKQQLPYNWLHSCARPATGLAPVTQDIEAKRVIDIGLFKARISAVLLAGPDLCLKAGGTVFLIGLFLLLLVMAKHVKAVRSSTSGYPGDHLHTQ